MPQTLGAESGSLELLPQTRAGSVVSADLLPVPATAREGLYHGCGDELYRNRASTPLAVPLVGETEAECVRVPGVALPAPETPEVQPSAAILCPDEGACRSQGEAADASRRAFVELEVDRRQHLVETVDLGLDRPVQPDDPGGDRPLCGRAVVDA